MSPLDRIRLIGPLLSIAMRRRLWIALLILYAGAIFALSQMPLQPGDPPFPYYDKCFHAMEFAVFAALAWKATGRQARPAFVLSAAYAGSDELHQLFVASRIASPLDLAADVFGILLALAVLEFARRLWGIRRRRILTRIHSEVES